jgi:hypothetical protein
MHIKQETSVDALKDIIDFSKAGKWAVRSSQV